MSSNDLPRDDLPPPAPGPPADATLGLTLPYDSGSAAPAASQSSPSVADTTGIGEFENPTKSHPAARPPSGDPDAPLPQLPGYQIVRRIARGGMGEVLEARHLLLNRTVAIKLPLAAMMTGRAERERFLREARAAAQLRHPRICAIHEVGQAGDCPYIVMDFIQGMTLKDWRAQNEPTARQAAEWVAGVARAVAYAHQHGVIHRDLKPSNVLIDAENSAPVLTDFGLAKQVGDENSQLTHTGQVMGTPAYMAPEQAAGQLDAVGPCSDIYSLGAVLYELLCGRPPFRGPTGSVLRQVQSDEPPSPRTINHRIHRDLETICLKAMAKDPRSRYETAAALADDLERFAAGEPIQARRLGRLARLGHWICRRPTTAAALAAALVAISLATWLAVEAGGTSRLSRLNQAFNAQLESADLDDAQLRHMETIADEMAALSAEQASAARQRLYRRLAERQKSLLRVPILDVEISAQVERALKTLRQRAPELEGPLRKALTERQRAWETVLRLARDEDAALIFPGQKFQWQNEGLAHAANASPRSQIVVTSVASPGNVELEAVFGGAWRMAPALGLVLNAVPQVAAPAENQTQAAREPPGYYFRLRVATDMQKAMSGHSAPQSASGNLNHRVLEIMRGLTLLAKQSVAPAALQGETLRIAAGRTAEHLWVKVGNEPVLAFRDVFPLSRSRPGVFALDWPPGATLIEIRGRRQRLPAVTSSLERGDDLFSQERFAEALAAYEVEQIASLGAPAAQEARYKAALCLEALERPEARRTFQTLAVEEGDRWPVLAACRVWADDLQERRFDDADAVLESLRGRYRFEQLVSIIPSDLRVAILRRYSDQAAQFSLFSRDPLRVERLRRAADVEDLLGGVNHPHYSASWSLLRALAAAGRLDEALALAEEMVGEGGAWQDAGAINWIDEDCWLLSLAGRTEEALARVDRQLFDARGKIRDDRAVLLLGRSRLLAALQRWDEAETDLDEYFRRFDRESGGYYFPVASLVRGLLRERRGDATGAIQAWRQGYVLDEGLTKQNGTVITATLILGSLTGDLTEAQAEWASGQLLAAFAAGSPVAAIKDMVRVPGVVLREAWRRPRGHEAAVQIGFRLAPFADFIRLPAAAIGTEFARQSAFGGQLSDDQEQVVWDLMSSSLDRYFEGLMTMPQFASLGMTWKGSTNFLGWGGVSGTLPAPYRASVAYLFAHRYQTLGKRDEAVAFLRTALADSPADSLVHRLAQKEAEAAHNAER